MGFKKKSWREKAKREREHRVSPTARFSASSALCAVFVQQLDIAPVFSGTNGLDLHLIRSAIFPLSRSEGVRRKGGEWRGIMMSGGMPSRAVRSPPRLLLPRRLIVVRRCCFLSLGLLTSSCLLYMILLDDVMVRYELKASHDPDLQEGGAQDNPQGNSLPLLEWLKPLPTPQLQGDSIGMGKTVHSSELDAIVVLRNTSANSSAEREGKALRIPHIIHQTWDDSKVPGQVILHYHPTPHPYTLLFPFPLIHVPLCDNKLR